MKSLNALNTILLLLWIILRCDHAFLFSFSLRALEDLRSVAGLFLYR